MTLAECGLITSSQRVGTRYPHTVGNGVPKLRFIAFFSLAHALFCLIAWMLIWDGFYGHWMELRGLREILMVLSFTEMRFQMLRYKQRQM